MDDDLRLIDLHRPIDFGPRGVPDARTWLHNSWRVGGPTETDQGGRGAANGAREDVSRHRRADLAESELYWVHPDMCRLVSHAAEGVPGETTLAPELLPARKGLAFFAAPPTITTQYTTQTITTQYTTQAADVVSWSWADLGNQDGTPAGRGLNILIYTAVALPPRLGVRFMVAESINWRRGSALNDPEAHSGKEQAARLLVAFAALIQSPGVATVTIEPPDRAVARRSAHAGLDLNDTRVIYLRHARTDGDGNGDDRAYVHRWIVSGHWRMQPYGPGRVERRPVWIAPYIKGPEGAPLLNGAKVTALVR